MFQRARVLLALLLGFSLIAGACGSDDGDDAAPAATTAAPAATTAAPAATTAAPAATTAAPAAAAADSSDPIKLPIHNWSSQIAGVYAVGAILESTGNSVEYISADSTLVYTSMCEGDMDLVHEVWEGAFGVAFMEQVDAGCVIDAATHDAKTREEWWYPSYIEDVCPGLPDWQALNACAEMFATPDSGGKGRFLGGPVDWLKGDQERVEGLEMDFIVENAGTAGALWAALEAASANQEPIVLFNWTPNFIEAMYDGKFIEFPTFADECRTDASWGLNPETTHDCGNPKDGYLKLGVWEGFPAKWPNAYAAVQKMNFSNLDIAQLAMYVDIDGMEPEDAAALWLAENCARWTGWSGADASACPAAPEKVGTVGDHLGDGSLGTVEVGSGEDIQIRSLNAISGDVAFLGIPNQRGVEMAIADYGSIGGHDVSMGTGLDDLCSADGGQAAAQTIVADESVVGVIGTSCSGAAAAAAPLISEANMVMISGSNTSPSLTSDLAGTAGSNNYPGYYRTAHNDLYQGAAAAGFAVEVLGVSSAAAIHDGDPYTQGLAQAFADAFEALGGTVTTFTAVNKGDTDMIPVLTEIAAGAPELLFFPIFQPEGDFIVQQASQVPGLDNTTMMAADGLLNSNYMAIAETEGMYFSGPDIRYGSNTNQSTGQTADGFLAAYNDEWGEDPAAPFWAHSYDATTLLLDAIAAASYDDGGTLVIDRAGVREHLAGVTDYAGIIGLMSCDAFGDCGSQKITVIGHGDSDDISASNANVVYEYAPAGSSEGSGDLVAPVIPVRGGTLVMATSQVGPGINHGVASGVGIGNVSSKIFASLVHLDANWDPQPYLAESWDVSDDQMTVTLNLVGGATFHDGAPITSADVKFSIEVVKNNHPFTGMWAPVDSIDTPDDLTVVLNLANPHPALWIAMSDVLMPIMPKHIMDDGTAINEMKGHPNNTAALEGDLIAVGSGPFVLTEWSNTEKIVMEAYEDFFIPGRPYLDSIIYVITPNEDTMMLGLESGEFDTGGYASVTNAEKVANNPDLVANPDELSGVGSLNHLQFNMSNDIIGDLRVRQAIAYTIDRDFVINSLHQGQTEELLGGIHPSSPFYNPDVERYDVDLDKARSLLAEAGYADGLELKIHYIPGPNEQQLYVAEYIALALAEVGVDAEVVQSADLPSWAGIFFGGPDAWHMTMNAYFNWGDPVIGVQRAYVCANIRPGVFVNNSAYCNEEVDEILYAAAAETDFDARKALYDEFQVITAVELPFYGINALPIYGAHQAYVKNMPLGTWGSLSGMENVWLDK